jgi:peptidoglycan/xylan/chitin deacetylase (PgdA/CDA1 family)
MQVARMRTNLIRVAKHVVRRVIGRPILGRSILLYHRVANADIDPWNLAVSPDEFERQLAGLRKKEVLPLRQFVRLHSQKKLPQNAVAITFDDGYACNALVAAPILESFGYPATFFVVSDAIVHGEEFWWDRLELIFHAPGFDYETAMGLLSARSLNGPSEITNCAPHAAFLKLWDLVRHLSTAERRRYLSDLQGLIGLKKQVRPTHRPMDAVELRNLAANPLFEIGGHTASHPSLPDLLEAEQEQEITFGARVLEDTIGQPIRAFSYPHGCRAPATLQIVMSAGFECAVTAEHKRVKSSDNRFELPRRQVVSRNVRTF